MQRDIPTWLAAAIILVVILVVIGAFVHLQRRKPPITPAELIKNPPNPAFTARPGIPPMRQSPNPTNP